MRIFTAFFLLVIINVSNIRAQQLDWVGQIAGYSDQRIYDLAVDDSSNFYVLGEFTFFTGFDLFNFQPDIRSNGSSDVFLAKYDEDGKLIWLRAFGGSGLDHGYNISLGFNGEVFIAGQFSGTVDFDPDSINAFVLNSQGGKDVFISEFDTNGNWYWTRSFGNANDDNVNTITADRQGIVYVGGEFEGTIDFNPGGTTGSFSNPNSNPLGYISSYDGNGNFRWVRPYGISLDNRHYIRTLKVSPNNELYGNLVLNFGAPLSFNSAPAEFMRNRIFKLDKTDGSYQMSQTLRFSARTFFTNFELLDLAFDQSSNLYFSGYFAGQVNLKGSGSAHIISTFDRLAGLIVKYDSLGNFIWSSQMESLSGGTSYHRKLDIRGEQIVTHGGFFDDVHLDSSKSLAPVNSNGNRDAFIGIYDTLNGTLIAQTSFGGPSEETPRKSMFLNQKEIISVGYFEDAFSFNPVDSTRDSLTAFVKNAYVQKLYFCPETYGQLNATSCNDYFAPSGKKFTSTGTFTDTISNIEGCDSIITINLTINPIDTSVSRLGDQLIVGESGSNVFYQWVDCNNAYSAITGETNQSFVPSSGGRYAAIVLKNSCQDTSRCVLSTVGLEEQVFANQIELFPNPTSNELNVLFAKKGIYFYELHDFSGNLIFNGEVNGKRLTLHRNKLNGIYLLKLLDQSGKVAIKKVSFFN